MARSVTDDLNGGNAEKIRVMPLSGAGVWRYVHWIQYSQSVWDRQTDRQICHNNIALCMHCMPTRDKRTDLKRKPRTVISNFLINALFALTYFAGYKNKWHISLHRHYFVSPRKFLSEQHITEGAVLSLTDTASCTASASANSWGLSTSRSSKYNKALENQKSAIINSTQGNIFLIFSLLAESAVVFVQKLQTFISDNTMVRNVVQQYCRSRDYF